MRINQTVLYKADRQPSVAARTPVKTARQHIATVAKRLGSGSTPRALMAFAQTHPKEFWTQLYARTIEKDVTLRVGLDDSLTALLAQSYANALPDSEPPSIVEGAPVQVIAAPDDDI